jgi:hypothetical protein
MIIAWEGLIRKEAKRIKDAIPNPVGAEELRRKSHLWRIGTVRSRAARVRKPRDAAMKNGKKMVIDFLPR